MTTPKRVLIVGAKGQLARVLAQTCPSGYVCTGLGREQLDIMDAVAVVRAIENAQPAWVINGAAYNLVDRAEDEGREEAFRVNAVGVGILARACAEAGARLVHFSTDLVFDGARKTPYDEDALPKPLGVYGASKLAGEHLALAADPRNLVVRICRLFGPTPPGRIAAKPVGNFPLLMLHLARERGRVRVVNDQVGSPSYLPDVARGGWQLIESGQSGLFHLANSGEASFADMAHETFRVSGVSCPLEAVSTAEYGAAARRPLYSTLDCRRAWAAGVASLRPWQEALAEFLAVMPPLG